MLLVVKFVLGLFIVVLLLVGVMGLCVGVFMLFDGFGLLLWVGVVVGLGYVFVNEVDCVLVVIE